MEIQIIKGMIESDQVVSKDGLAVYGVDFSGMASDIWAVHWDQATKKGEIEWETNTTKNQSVTSEAEIDSALGGITLQTLLDRRQAILDAREAAAAKELQDTLNSDTRPQWQRDRELEYPMIFELIVALYDTEDKAALVTKRAEVKAKWPKDGSGPIE